MSHVQYKHYSTVKQDVFGPFLLCIKQYNKEGRAW